MARELGETALRRLRMPYTAQIVVYLDADLQASASAIANKPGNVTVSFSRFPGGNADLPAAALQGVIANMRLVIVGHGDPASTSIGNQDITPKHLAEIVAVWLGGVRIQRISLHMCHGGGNRGAAVGARVQNFQVHPQNSFAYAFASYCGALSVDVTARTESVGTSVVPNSQGYGRHLVHGRKAGAGDKVFFATNALATIAAPQDPGMSIRL
jgi:hypothetical protein